MKRALKHLQKEIKNVTNKKKTQNQTGLAFFATDQQCTLLIPPFLSTLSIYRCDKTFYLEPLQMMNINICETIAFFVVGGEELKLYHCRIHPEKLLLDSITHAALIEKRLIYTYSSWIRSKHGRGGFSANRFERLRENDVDHYIKEIINLDKQYNDKACLFTLFYGSKDKIDRLEEKKRTKISFCYWKYK